jgi:hypothetical protein
MEAKELRIGNYVNDHLSRVQKVSETRSDAYICYLSNGNKLKYKLNTTTPIPLTEDWLLKFGFEKGKDEYNFNGFDLEDRNTDQFLSVDKIIKLKNNFGCWYVGTYLRELKHVHQLQNLYFALTGEELNLK